MSTGEPANDLHDALEATCRRGCRYVLGAIAALERGEVPAELSALHPDQRQRALDELRAVMAVYDRECSLDPGESL
jgi:hypothetical protein